jgi:ABC-type transporter Mla MlaB component
LTIRINRRDAADGVVIELHGWLSQEVLAEFGSACDSVGDPLRIDLSQLAGTDEAGLAALKGRIVAGARIEGASPYIRLLLDSSAAGPRSRKREGDK